MTINRFYLLSKYYQNNKEIEIQRVYINNALFAFRLCRNSLSLSVYIERENFFKYRKIISISNFSMLLTDFFTNFYMVYWNMNKFCIFSAPEKNSDGAHVSVYVERSFFCFLYKHIFDARYYNLLDTIHGRPQDIFQGERTVSINNIFVKMFVCKTRTYHFWTTKI